MYLLFFLVKCSGNNKAHKTKDWKTNILLTKKLTF